jgi:CRISPR-associated protein Cas6
MHQQGPIVDLCFPLAGKQIPADHGYALLGAIAREVPGVHGDGSIGVHPIDGRAAGQRTLDLTPRSHLAIRLPLRRVPELVKLTGVQIDLDGHVVVAGIPAVRQLIPAPHCAADWS